MSVDWDVFGVADGVLNHKVCGTLTFEGRTTKNFFFDEDASEVDTQGVIQELALGVVPEGGWEATSDSGLGMCRSKWDEASYDKPYCCQIIYANTTMPEDEEVTESVQGWVVDMEVRTEQIPIFFDYESSIFRAKFEYGALMMKKASDLVLSGTTLTLAAIILNQ